MNKKILLFTSEKVGDTGKVSFSYLFQDKTVSDIAWTKFREQCSGPFGIMTEIEDGYHFNLFQGGQGFICGGPVYPGERGTKYNILEGFPDACNMLCTKEIAEGVKPLLEELGATVDVVFSGQTLLTA